VSDLPLVPHDGAAADGEQLYVLFKVGDAEYALPASLVLQMESFAEATAVPGGAPFLAGIMPIRGRVVPVIDLRVRFGQPKVAATLDSRVVVGQLRDRTVALLADSAREVVKIRGAELKAPPRLMSDGDAAYVQAIAQIGKRMVLVLDFAKVIGEEIDAV
jgi:purine-binding chemotaxis protein CheW